MSENILALVHAEVAKAKREGFEAGKQAAIDLILKYAVNLGGNGELKPLHEDHRGSKDAVRQSYAFHIAELEMKNV